MSNADAVRMLADEHHLEFVDLDRFNVDASASSVIPVAVARRHHVVPIGRKFGAPVVAMSNPADVMAMDVLRAVIGREFVAVVASDDQIDACLSRIYGAPPPDSGKKKAAASSRPPATTASNGSSNGSSNGYGPTTPPPPPAVPSPKAPPKPAASAAPAPAPTPSAPLPPPAPAMPPMPASASVAPPAAAPSSTTAPAPAAPAAPGSPTTSPKPQVSGDAPAAAVRPEAPTASPSSAAPAKTAETAETPTPASADAPAAPSVPRPTGGDGKKERAEDVLAAALEVIDSSLGESRLTMPPADGAPVAAMTLDIEEPGEPAQPSAPTAEQVADTVRAADLVEEVVAEFEHSAETTDTDDVPAGLGGFPPLARVLVEGDRVSLDDMEEVLAERDRTGQAIARILTMRGLVTEADLMWGMAQEMGLEFVDLEVQSVDFGAAYHLPETTARHHNVLVIGMRDGVVVVAASNPTDVFAMDDLRTIIGRNFVTVVATRSQINAFIDKAYHQGGDATEVANTAASDFEDMADEELGNLQAVVDDAPIVRYVNLLILQALNERASDIHVEPTGENLRIRYRIDGVLHDISTAPRAISAAVTTRLKVMADMNIAEHRLPQDGRISLTVGNRPIDLRMATLPTIYGEKVVMRVLDKSNVVLGFEDLGFDSDLLEIYRKLFTKPYGTIFVTGPTGSGKTTTLYATLAALNDADKNIITVEDPVELRIKGINQVQLNIKAGLTFASALRSILRSDPDIVLVGEIRDRETAMISVEAALTGHMVLATLHTNDSASTPMRLVEMGLEPYLVTSAISGALAQRLSRRLCVHCKETYEPTEADIVAAGWKPAEVFTDNDKPLLYRAVGCSACSKTGYRGRKALLELLVVTEDVERMIIEGGTADDIHKLAVEQGMVTLRQSGLRKALEGETTLEEVLRVVA
ncbi:MAG TPA: ATPase, T2SS/T4P/T4SS family [Acidimicrobiales bacterium]|nr:ATPase, T2SS/T4P/T4SS family [Acidimicrobiales bacterium]